MPVQIAIPSGCIIAIGTINHITGVFTHVTRQLSGSNSLKITQGTFQHIPRMLP